MPPDLFPHGLFFEALFKRLSGGASPDSEAAELRDVEAHVVAAQAHDAAARAALGRFDLVNALINLVDAGSNVLFAVAVAARLTDPTLRRRAFVVLDELPAPLLVLYQGG